MLQVATLRINVFNISGLRINGILIPQLGLKLLFRQPYSFLRLLLMSLMKKQLQILLPAIVEATSETKILFCYSYPNIFHHCIIY